MVEELIDSSRFSDFLQLVHNYGEIFSACYNKLLTVSVSCLNTDYFILTIPGTYS